VRVKRPHPPERPLDPLPTLKLKISVIILAAVAVTVGVFFVGLKAGLWPSVAGVFSGFVALAVVWVLARGLTSPLREMVGATEAMARGDFTARVTAISHDEIGTLAHAFNQMAAELAETDRLRRDLVANVSHELRTPITALQAVLENLVDGVGKADPETLRTMLAQVERLGRLVEQLLDLSRLESGTLPLDRDLFDVRPMIEHAIRESQLHAADVNFAIEIVPRDFRLEADAERLHQVVANFVENAVRHSPPNGRVSVRAVAAPDGGARLEVSDDGPGIPDTEVTRVFERFYRADSARSSSDGGAGLGLAIARWIVELHGGDIRVARNEPHGCRMIATIPGRIELMALPTPELIN
jgi:signal transduction histidine kinase